MYFSLLSHALSFEVEGAREMYNVLDIAKPILTTISLPMAVLQGVTPPVSPPCVRAQHSNLYALGDFKFNSSN